VAPAKTPGKSSFRLRARASDTGGNATWTDEITVALLPDITPPRVSRTFPFSGAILGSADLVLAYFNEPIAAASLTEGTLSLQHAGADQIPGNADDIAITSGETSYRTNLNAIAVNFGTNLPSGLYQATVGPGVADLSGNLMTTPRTWIFWLTGNQDSDQDGLPDAVELNLGLDPNQPDSLGDGVLDGERILAGDGLTAQWKILFGYSPILADSDANGILDKDEDPDRDGLNNLKEYQVGTNPRNADTDGDGWPDEAEVTGGGNPLSTTSRPFLQVMAHPPTKLILPRYTGGGIAPNVTVAAPPVTMVLPSAGDSVFMANVTVAHPPLQVVVPGLSANGLSINVTVAQPPLQVLLSGLFGSSLSNNVTVAQPPVTVRFNSQ
jgi:hypothetical protein